MLIEFLGKFYDNHSLSIVNRNIVLNLHKLGANIQITALDSYEPSANLDKNIVKILKELEKPRKEVPAVQVRHSYPPVWAWPKADKTKIVFIQPWEFSKVPFEWQYKFETFADNLIVPSNYCSDIFLRGGINPANIEVIPNGIDPTIFNKDEKSAEHLGINNKKFNFVYVGNSQWRKGLDILLNVWAHSFTKSDNVRLIIKDSPKIYGKSNILQESINLQYKTGCGEIVYIDDDLSDKDMACIYSNSNVIVHPYRAEGFAMHVQEAIACGALPIVSSNGPTDDFIPEGKGIKIPVTTKLINIEDPQVFAMKPGDSANMMGSHTFIQEPSADHLKNALQKVYYSHDRKTLLKDISDIEISNTWEKVATQYLSAFTAINNKKGTNRRK